MKFQDMNLQKYGELNQKLKQVEFCYNAMEAIVLNFKRLMKFEAMNM